MSQTLTPGRWNGLHKLSSPQRTFNIIAFDQRESYVKMLPANAPHQQAVAVKRETVQALSPHASGFLLDPTFGVEPALYVDRTCGLLMALEKSGYTGDSTYRRIEFYDGWTIEKIKRMGAAGVKLLVYYHPHSGALAEEIEALVKSVAEQCAQHDITLFLEPVSYSLDAKIAKSSKEFAATKPQVVLDTVKRLGKLGETILKLEFPVDGELDGDLDHWKAACSAISEVCPVPWVVLSAGVDFTLFKPQVEIACQCGASGYLAGRAIWKECVGMSSQERQHFLATTGLNRTDELTELATTYAAPWTKFYEPVAIPENWFTSY